MSDTVLGALQAARDLLNEICSWSEGERVTGCFDCPEHARQARAILPVLDAALATARSAGPTAFCADGEDVRIEFAILPLATLPGDHIVRDRDYHNPDTCPRCRKEGV